jgi:histidine ammonia-lyase
MAVGEQLAKGAAGVRLELAEMMVDALNRIRSRPFAAGSVGQADLGPMADLAEGCFARSASSSRTTRGWSST